MHFSDFQFLFLFLVPSFVQLFLLVHSSSEFQNVKLLKPSEFLHQEHDQPSFSSNIETSTSASTSSTTENYYDGQRLPLESAASKSTSSRVLDPLGIWRSARNVVKKGIHRFRESLHEGVKVAQMLKEDVNEGVSNLMGPANLELDTSGPKSPNRKSRQNGVNETLIISGEIAPSPSIGSKTVWEALSSLSTIKDIDKNLENEFGKLAYQLPRQGVLGGILRFMGYDSSSLGIILLNILIFVAEMVTSTMLGKDANSIDTRALKANLYEWAITGQNEQVSKLLNEAQSPDLTEHLIDALKRKSGMKTSCVQLLVCKMGPFIRGIQQTVNTEFQAFQGNSTESERARRATTGLESYFSSHYLEFIWSQLVQLVPDKTKFLALGDNCEKKFPTCKLLKFAAPKAEKGKITSKING